MALGSEGWVQWSYCKVASAFWARSGKNNKGQGSGQAASIGLSVYYSPGLKHITRPGVAYFDIQS